jgi:hypothetical protein
MTAISELQDHYERQFRTLETVYDRTNEAAWAYADQRLKGIWQWMAHLLETIEFYLGERDADAFPWGHRFHVDWEDDQAQPVPSPEAMRTYQEDVRAFTMQVLAGKTDADLMAPELAQPWTGQTYLGRLLYLLRHTQQHIGDINRVLRVNGCDALQWH